MARALRINLVDGWHHVSSRGYKRRKRCGLKLRELGQLVGGIDDSSVGMAMRRLAERARRDRRLAGLLQRVAAQLEG